MLAGALLRLALTASSARADDPPLPEERWRSAQTGALRADRLQHASLAFTLGLGAGLASESPAAGFATAAGLGVVKEALDLRTTRFDWGDLAADLAGAGLAALAVRSLER